MWLRRAIVAEEGYCGHQYSSTCYADGFRGIIQCHSISS